MVTLFIVALSPVISLALAYSICIAFEARLAMKTLSNLNLPNKKIVE